MKYVFSIAFLLLTKIAFQQSCPTYDKRNNGAGTQGCLTETPPDAKIKSGQFDFTNNSTNINFTVDSIMLNGQLYQKGSVLYNNLGNIWFGGYNGSSKVVCFYGINQNDNAPPAGRWSFFFKNNNTQTVCNYTLTSTGTLSSFSPGTIGTNQTICSGQAPAQLTNSSSPTGCSGTVSYQWRSSTISSNEGFSDITSANTLTFSPPALTQTTYFTRIESCSDGSSVNSNVITITVLRAGTISGSQTVAQGQTTTLTSNGQNGGTWSSSNPSIASVDPNSGVVTGSSIGNATITYSVAQNGLTCSSNLSVTVTDPLPVTWLSFTGKKVAQGIELNWSTSSEQNTKDFQVQHSINAQQWTAVGSLPAAGNSNAVRNYRFVHEGPFKNSIQHYYRILQRDLDEKSSFSKIIRIEYADAPKDVVLYPNPASDVLHVNLTERQEVRLVNMQGVVVWKAVLAAGRHEITVSNYASGAYVLQTEKGAYKVILK